MTVKSSTLQLAVDALTEALEAHYDSFREEQETTVGFRKCTHGENTDYPDFKWIPKAKTALVELEAGLISLKSEVRLDSPKSAVCPKCGLRIPVWKGKLEGHMDRSCEVSCWGSGTPVTT